MSSDDLLGLVAQSTTQTSGDAFFENLVRSAAQLIGVTYCFVTECIDENNSRVSTRAVWADGVLVENFIYDVSGTPCDDTLRGKYRHNGGPIDRGPAQASAHSGWTVTSYFGAAMVDSYGAVVGHIAVMHDQPRTFSIQDEWVLRIFAARGAAELVARHHRDKRYAAERSVAEAVSLNSSTRGVIHDLNNLFLAIQGNVELLNEEVERKSRILAATLRARALSRSLLDLSTNTVTGFDLRSIVEEVADLARATSPAITLDVNASGSTFIQADEVQIYRVLLNLVGNAISALGHQPGSLTIDVHELSPNRENEPSMVELKVTDTGAGIDVVDIERIFDRGYTTQSNSHHGIGLAEVARIVERHLGSISIESEKGKKTTFTIVLPQTQK